MSNSPSIDPKSVASLLLDLYSRAPPSIGTGSGFIVALDGRHYLVTNHHVLSGRHPETGKAIHADLHVPDRVLFGQLRRDRSALSWTDHVQLLEDEDGQPLWVAHPVHGARFDVAVLPVLLPAWSHVVPYEVDAGHDLAIEMGSDVCVIGFPAGMSGHGLTALWKTGHVASEPELINEEQNFFWVDAGGAPGLSGAPVVARRFGSVPMRSGQLAMMTGGPADRTLGVYSGRATKDLSLARVWRWKGVLEIIEHAAARVVSGQLRPRVGLLEHNGGVKLAKEIQNDAVDVLFPNAPTQRVSVARFCVENLLTDGRFGMNLERLRMAAAIRTACDSAEKSSSKIELSDEQHSVLVEAASQPQNWAYNPVAGLQMLPLIDLLLKG